MRNLPCANFRLSHLIFRHADLLHLISVFWMTTTNSFWTDLKLTTTLSCHSAQFLDLEGHRHDHASVPIGTCLTMMRSFSVAQMMKLICWHHRQALDDEECRRSASHFVCSVHLQNEVFVAWVGLSRTWRINPNLSQEPDDNRTNVSVYQRFKIGRARTNTTAKTTNERSQQTTPLTRIQYARVLNRLLG
jgi:hypothetical protein